MTGVTKTFSEITPAVAAMAATDYLLGVSGGNDVLFTAAQLATWSGGVAQGGTGITSYTVGDMIYASATTTLSKRAAVAVGQVLISQGVATAPVWSGSPTISTQITPVASGGADLGTTALPWGSMFLKSGGVINWNSGNVTLTHSAGLLALSSSFVIGGSALNTTYLGAIATPSVQQQGTSIALAASALTAWIAASTGPNVFLTKSRGAAVGTRGIVQSGDQLGSFRFEGDDGTNFVDAAAILAFVDGTPGTNDMPGRLSFQTSPDGSVTLAQRMAIFNDGGVNIGSSTTSPGAGVLNVAATTVSTSTTTGAFTVGGGAGILKELYVGGGASGSLTVNCTTATTAISTFSVNQDWSATAGTNLLAIVTSYGDSARYVIRRANGTQASSSGVLSGNALGAIQFRGYTSAGAFSGGVLSINGVAAEDFTSSALGCYFSFGTVPIGSTAGVVRLVINHDGGVLIGSSTTSPGAGVLAVAAATDATTTTDGSLRTAGGLSVVKNAVIGGDVSITGGTGAGTAATTTCFMTLAAGTTAKSALRFVQGAAPTAPVDGDMWREDNTNTGLKVRINGVTKTVTVS